MDSTEVPLRTLRALRGPNRYAPVPVMYAELDTHMIPAFPTTAGHAAVARLQTWLPTLAVGTDFPQDAGDGVMLAQLWAAVAGDLQRRVGFPVTVNQVQPTAEPGVIAMIIGYAEEVPARLAVETAGRLTLAALHDTLAGVDDALEALWDVAEDYRFGPSTAAIVAAAQRRSIPVTRVTPREGLVHLGYGVHQRRIQAAQTSATSAIAVAMAQDKALTSRMLRTVGLPVPDSQPVRSASEAWAVAQEVGLPVVVKPEDGNQGKGVSVGLTTAAEVAAAYSLARSYSRVLIERFIPGDDYRLLVVNGAMVAAARRDPAHVIGDGEQPITALVAQANQDPLRRPGHSSALTQLVLNEESDLVLRQQGLDRTSVPAAGQHVRLRTNANLSTGGTATDVTDRVHPQTARMAVLAAQVLGLDIAGIDIVCRDITQPLPAQGGAIIEVNAAPGLRMHLHPTVGTPRDVGDPIVAALYPDGATGRIPIIAITGTNGKTTVTRLIAHIVATTGTVVGMTCTEGILIDGEVITTGDCSGPQSAQTVLLHPQVEVAVLETARGGLLRAGLAFDRCTVGVVTNVSADHLGIGGIRTVDDLAQVKQVVVTAVDPTGAAVLNADDPRVAAMAAACAGRVIYTSRQADTPIVTAHLTQGGQAVLIRDGVVLLAEGRGERPLVAVAQLPWTSGGALGFQVENALAATAAAWAAGVDPAVIAQALTSFTTSSDRVPGRFNVREIHGVEVILDYAHNQGALAALTAAVQALEPRQTVLVMTLPGDRQDVDLLASFDATHGMAHAYVLYDSADRRGRAVGALPTLLRTHVPPGMPVTCASDTATALAAAWRQVQPGDRLVLIADQVETALHALDHLAAGTLVAAATAGQDSAARHDPAGVGSGPLASRQEAPADAEDADAGGWSAAAAPRASAVGDPRAG